MKTLKQIGTHVIIQKVSRPDRDGHYIGRTGIITKFEKHNIKGTLCHLKLDDGNDFCSLKDNIDVVPNVKLRGAPFTEDQRSYRSRKNNKLPKPPR